MSRSTRRCVGRVLPVLLGGVLAACGSSSKATGPHPTGRTTETASATPAVITGDEGDPKLIPLPADTPVEHAPEALVNEWMPYIDQLTVIPNTSVPFRRPPTPPVTNATGGAVDDVTAHRWADALMREFAWENWAISTAQIAFLDNGAISARQVEAGIALPQGATGLEISGSRWPSTVRLVKVPQNVKTFLTVSDDYAWLVTFREGFSVNAVFAGGRTQALSDNVVPAGATGFVVGHLLSKPDLGDLWYGSASYGCANEPPALTALCAE